MAPVKKAKAKPSTAVAVHQPQQQVAVAAPRSLLEVIALAVRDPACDAAKMNAMLDVQERIEARDAKKAFNDAFILLQGELPVIRADRKIEIKAKDSTGERNGRVLQSTPYATFANIMKICFPILQKHGFTLAFSTEPMPDGRLLVRGHLKGYGHEQTTAFPLPAETSGSKNNLQGWGSSQSYGKRYCTIALLNIISEAIEDADTDGHKGNFVRSKDGFADIPEETVKITDKQLEELLNLLTWAGISDPNFCATYGLTEPGDLPANLFDAAKKRISDHHAAKARKAAKQ
jgi:hypothetical protein